MIFQDPNAPFTKEEHDCDEVQFEHASRWSHTAVIDQSALARLV